jgi:hypothetical protein
MKDVVRDEMVSIKFNSYFYLYFIFYEFLNFMESSN